MSLTRFPVLLVIRDGWGANPHLEQNSFNAIHLARKLTDDQLHEKYPVTLIKTSGLDVGLPDGQMGNSEVGHENIGAGRVVEQELLRLNKLFSEKLFAENPVWLAIVERLKKNPEAKLCIMGITSNGGVHGTLEHLYSILQQAKDDGLVGRVFVHSFMDGRDTPPQSGLGYIKAIEAKIHEIGIGKIATVCGRFWAMDRDNRWERVQKAYDLLTGRSAVATATTAEQAVQQYYDKPLSETQKGDEFVSATAIVGPDGKQVASIGNGDAVFFYNYRGDRPREITRAFVLDDFKSFDRGPKLDLYYATMTEYEKGLPVHVVLGKPPSLKNILGEVVSKADIAQFRCAETEKNPHVTFFFNNYRSEPFSGEDRACQTSPKVVTYDLQPEMSAAEVTSKTKEAIFSRKYGLIVVNYANPDMVGHTGSLQAAIKACEATDEGLGQLLKGLASKNGRAVVLADHGNAEQMWNPDLKAPHTAHTLNPVEAFVVGENFAAGKTQLRSSGRLADIAPTVLQLMDLPKPAEMTGESLIVF